MEPKRCPNGAHVIPKGTKVAPKLGAAMGPRNKKNAEHSALFFTEFRGSFRGQSRKKKEPVCPTQKQSQTETETETETETATYRNRYTLQKTSRPGGLREAFE